MSAKKQPTAEKTYTISAAQKELLDRLLTKEQEEQAAKDKEERRLLQLEAFRKESDKYFPKRTPEEYAVINARLKVERKLMLLKNHEELQELLAAIENKETSVKLLEAQLELMPTTSF